MQRGNNRMLIFRVPADYRIFLTALHEAARRYLIALHGYALMPNHYHLVLTPPHQTALARAMQSIGRRYGRYFNEEYGRTGTLFEGRYRSVAIESEVYWVTCMRYVEMNPVRAGLTDRPGRYTWSSFRANGFGRADRLLTPHPLYLALGCSPAERQHAWRTICTPLPAEQLAAFRRQVRDGGAAGPIATHSAPPPVNEVGLG